MKKKLIVLITVAIMLLTASVFSFVGCDSEEQLEYSVTVLSVDEEPVENVTVSWQQFGKTQGSAVTDAEGVATATIPAGTYAIVLSGIDEGLTYPQVSVSAASRDVTLPLEVAIVTYTAEVVDKTGAAASGVTVTWSDGTNINSDTTDEDGKASCELTYGDYSVTVSNLPDGNIFTDAIAVTGKAPNARFELSDGSNVSYTVTVRSAGGLKFKDTTVFVYSDNKPVHSGKTDENGVLAFSQAAGNYTASVPNVQDGYTVTKQATLTVAERQGEIVLTSEVQLTQVPANTKYKIGDIIHDFEWTTPYEVNGSKVTYSIAELLETKDAVLINNWGTQCTWCVREMPAMEEVYKKFSDKIEFLAISNYEGGDSDRTIINHRENNGYTFPMMRDTANFYRYFNITGWPTTVIIDRYGAIAHIESGAIADTEVWERLINRYIGDDYEQTFTPGKDNDSIMVEISKPDITVPDDHYEKIAAAINSFEANDTTSVVWFGETKSEFLWPFILKTEEGVSPEKEVLCSSNSEHANSMSALYATVKMPVGKVLTFDYYSETETDADILSVAWDGKMTIKQISGRSQGWKTCYLYTELVAGEHNLTLSYIKDESVDTGKDNVFIRNVRFTDVADIVGPIDMQRSAAYGVRETNSKEYPYYANVKIDDDGYYHVTLSELQNNKNAGDDPSPMLFVNMLGVTNWSPMPSSDLKSISDFVYANDGGDEDEEVYVYDCNLNVDGVTRDYRADLMEYCRIAAASDLYGFLPVDKELHDLLVAFMAKISGDNSHEKEWLDACYFYSHYGDDDDTIGNPIIGLSKKTAIVAEVGKTLTADVTRIMAPFPTVVYAFTPEESAVYKIESLLPSGNKAAQIWLYDDKTDAKHPIVYDGDDRFYRDGKNEQNFVIYRYMAAGQKYYLEVAFLMQEAGDLDFKITNVGQSAAELVPCAAGYFNLILDTDGKTVLGIELAGTVEYGKDGDGYYHVKNADGSLGDFIYFDVKYPTRVTPTQSISQLVDQKLKVPGEDKYCDYYMFDLRYMIAYYTEQSDEGEYFTTCEPNFDLTAAEGLGDRVFKDYTDIIKGYIAKAETSGESAGLVKVDDQLIELLQLFIETRVNMFENNEYEAALDNEWLRFCWYYKTHNEANP